MHRHGGYFSKPTQEQADYFFPEQENFLVNWWTAIMTLLVTVRN